MPRDCRRLSMQLRSRRSRPPATRYACALRRHPRPDHRHRIEHCSVCPPHLLRRIADLGMTVVTQPSFIYSSGDRYLKTVSRDQRAHLYAIGSMIGCGLRVGFSSDCPISDANPIVGIQAAVTRMTEEGNVLLPRRESLFRMRSWRIRRVRRRPTSRMASRDRSLGENLPI